MNWQYQTNEAKLALNASITSSVQSSKADDIPHLSRIDVHNLEAKEYGEPPSLRLTQTIDSNPVEVVAKVVGIIASKTLPPIRRLRSTQPEHVRYLRQFVRLTGLGLLAFDETNGLFDEVRQKMAQVEGVECVEDFTFGLYESKFCIDLHSRYLTDRKLVGSQAHVPFPADVDPNHVLEEARGTRYVRVGDNVVQYTKRIQTPAGAFLHERCSPGDFKEGDIVEATASFIGYPTAQRGVYKPVFHLCSLTILEDKFCKDSEIKRARSSSVDGELTGPPPKRSRGKRQLPCASTITRSVLQYSAGETDYEMK